MIGSYSHLPYPPAIRPLDMRLLLSALALIVVSAAVGSVCPASAKSRRARPGAPYLPPDRVSVLPVFIVPRGEKPPSAEQMARLMEYVERAQRRYLQMLGGRDTFEIADSRPHVYQGRHDLAFYRKQVESCAPCWTRELLDHYGVTRFNCPYVLLGVLINPHDGFPGGGGRPINGGLNTGGGIVIVSAHGLMNPGANFQSTLEHELGHAFGLPHVNTYGYDMRRNPSIMSYNRAHHTKGLEPAATPGVLIPEDIRALALNKRVFRRLRFDPAKDVPAGYSMHRRIVCLGPMNLPDDPGARVLATTTSGEARGSSVSRIVGGRTNPSQSRFNRRTMWASGPAETGRVAVDVEFPVSVRLDRIIVHSQCDNGDGAADALAVQAQLKGKFRTVVRRSLGSPDDEIAFRPRAAKTWRLVFQTAPNQEVVVRGLRFFSGDSEVFPPLIPYAAEAR